MKNQIINYLVNESGFTDIYAGEVYNKVVIYEDILQEFIEFINTGSLINSSGSVVVEGYSANRIVNETMLKPIGAYNYLIYLRENPKEALDNLTKGLPRK